MAAPCPPVGIQAVKIASSVPFGLMQSHEGQAVATCLLHAILARWFVVRSAITIDTDRHAQGEMQALRTVVLHIGWPKTGTTTLQKHVFANVKGHRYLGKTPFVTGANKHTFRLVHALAYASAECFHEEAEALRSDLARVETERYGNVDDRTPAIISEEGVLSSLLKPSDHQHHGYSTASLSQIADRLLQLESLWKVRFELLVSERDPMEILHAYYAQMYHVFRTFGGLKSFQGYIRTGTSGRPGHDLGFRYLQGAHVRDTLVHQFGAARVHCIPMNELFTDVRVRLSAWYPAFPDAAIGQVEGENKRSIAKDVKLTHLRPVWMPKARFRLIDFLRAVRAMHRERYADHSKLEVQVVMTDGDREALSNFFRSGA